MFAGQEAAVKYLTEYEDNYTLVWDTVHYMLLISDLAPSTCLSVLRELKKANYVEITEDNRAIRYIPDSEWREKVKEYLSEV